MDSDLTEANAPAAQHLREALALYDDLMASEDAELRGPLQEALQVLSDALRIYGPDKLVVAFNGGKDAVVIMHLARAALGKWWQQNPAMENVQLSVIYFENPDEFPEVEQFVQATIERYHLNAIRKSSGFVDGIAECIASIGTQAFVLGTRRGDPNCGSQQFFAPSSDWMPAFMRVNPVIEWEYPHVWRFLRSHDLPYCSLYDQGYTSLGKRSNTVPNPALRLPDGTHSPAYMLFSHSLERAGRTSKSRPSKDSAAVKCGGPLLEVMSDGTLGGSAAACMVVLGDSMLKGDPMDENAGNTAQALHKMGVPLGRVCSVPGTREAIVEELRAQTAAYDVVFVSGGLCPAEDEMDTDFVLGAVADVFGIQRELNEAMVSHLKSAYQVGTLSKAQVAMATLPEGTCVLFPPGSPDASDAWPVLQCGNVFLLPASSSRILRVDDEFFSNLVKDKDMCAPSQ